MARLAVGEGQAARAECVDGAAEALQQVLARWCCLAAMQAALDEAVALELKGYGEVSRVHEETPPVNASC
jgi:hypothetical protein